MKEILLYSFDLRASWVCMFSLKPFFTDLRGRMVVRINIDNESRLIREMLIRKNVHRKSRR